METCKLHRSGDYYDEEITFGDLADVLNYANQFTGGEASTAIAQPDEDSANGLVETMIADDVEIAMPPMQVAVEEHKRSDEAATLAKGMEVRNHFGDLVGWLQNPGVTTAIRTLPRTRISARIVNAAAAWRDMKRTARVFTCCSCPPK